MKNLTVFLAFLSFGFAAMAQSETAPKDAPAAPAKTQQAPAERKVPPPSEYVKMKEGKLWHTKDGKTTELTEEVTLGVTKVKPDGTVVMKDGTTSKLKEENVVNKNGNIIDVAAFRQKAMEQKKPEQNTAEPK